MVPPSCGGENRKNKIGVDIHFTMIEYFENDS